MENNGVLKFAFRESEMIRNTPLEGLGLSARPINALHRALGREPLIGDVLDNWSGDALLALCAKRGAKGFGRKSIAQLHAAIFSYIVNHDPNDSVHFVEG